MLTDMQLTCACNERLWCSSRYYAYTCWQSILLLNSTYISGLLGQLRNNKFTENRGCWRARLYTNSYVANLAHDMTSLQPQQWLVISQFLYPFSELHNSTWEVGVCTRDQSNSTVLQSLCCTLTTKTADKTTLLFNLLCRFRLRKACNTSICSQYIQTSILHITAYYIAMTGIRTCKVGSCFRPFSPLWVGFSRDDF